MDAARFWAKKRRGGRDETNDALAAFGIDLPEPDEDEPEDDGLFAVFVENMPICRVFLAMTTQWNHAGMNGVITGLNYQALPVVLELSASSLTPAQFEGLQMMELAALAELNTQ